MGSKARTNLVSRLGPPSLAQEGRSKLSPPRSRENIDAAQNQAHLARGGHSFLGVDTEGTREGAPQGGCQALQSALSALFASPSSGRGVPAPLGTVQRYGLPAGSDQRSAAGPWQSSRASPGRAGGLCPVTTGALCSAQACQTCARPANPF